MESKTNKKVTTYCTKRNIIRKRIERLSVPNALRATAGKERWHFICEYSQRQEYQDRYRQYPVEFSIDYPAIQQVGYKNRCYFNNKPCKHNRNGYQ